jgi:hypothetical protein
MLAFAVRSKQARVTVESHCNSKARAEIYFTSGRLSDGDATCVVGAGHACLGANGVVLILNRYFLYGNLLRTSVHSLPSLPPLSTSSGLVSDA